MGSPTNPYLKVVAAEPERTSTRSSVEICLAPPEMAEQHACPGASGHFASKSGVISNDWSR
jgi:hypothetical protein